MGIVDLIVSVIREERVFGTSAPKGQTTATGQKHPVIRTTDQRDEKRRHLVIVGDLIKNLTLFMHQFTQMAADSLFDLRLTPVYLSHDCFWFTPGLVRAGTFAPALEYWHDQPRPSYFICCVSIPDEQNPRPVDHTKKIAGRLLFHKC